MCATMSEDQDFVICGSEDGKVYIWNRFNQYVPEINPMYSCDKTGDVDSRGSNETTTHRQNIPRRSARRQ